MKLSVIALWCVLAWGSGLAGTFEAERVTGDDMVRALDLDPEDYGVRKFRVDLGAKRGVTVRYSFGKEVRTWKLEGRSRVLTILINEPKEGERVRRLMFWVDGEEDGAQAFFDFDSTRVQHWKVGYVDGVFTIAVGPEADGSKVEYKIEILGEG